MISHFYLLSTIVSKTVIIRTVPGIIEVVISGNIFADDRKKVMKVGALAEVS